MAGLTLVTAATVEPLTVEEAAKHLRVDGQDELDYVSALIAVARSQVEERLGRALLNQTWELSLDGFPACDRIVLPRAPLSSVTSVTYVAGDGTSTTWNSADYVVKTFAGPTAPRGTLTLAYGASWPVPRSQRDCVAVRFVAGYGADAASVPKPIRQAMLLILADLYEQRQDVVTGTIVNSVRAADALLQPYYLEAA